MMADREKLIEILRKPIFPHELVDPTEAVADYLLDNGVTVRNRGRWVQVQRWATKAKYRCSICGREIMSAVTVNIEKYPYCHCGADMRG